MAAGMVGRMWAEEARHRGAMVALYRQYARGDHRLKLTAEMRKMLQITDDRIDRYNANYCGQVVAAMADRLTVEAVTAQDEAASAWAAEVLGRNRFDALQIEVREAALRDGETFVMVEPVDDGVPRLAHEPAWDGETGVLGVYDRRGGLVGGAKVWEEPDGKRANIYYQNRVEKFRTDEDSDELVLIEVTDTTRDGLAGGVPLVRFANRGRGVSELVNVIPLQDSLNRTLHSMVMAAELTAFSMLFAKGFQPPTALTPGMIISALVENEKGRPMVPETAEEAAMIATITSAYTLERIGAGDLAQLIGQATFLIDQIATISATPIPGQMGGDSQSGEALKQRDTRLLGKVHRAQVQFGNAWEDVLGLAARQAQVFSGRQVDAGGWTARWKTAELRNDLDILAAAKLMYEWGFEREALRLLSQSSLADYSEDDIERMMAEKRADATAGIGALGASLPGLEMLG